MKITIPVYVEKTALKEKEGAVYTLRPLFFAHPVSSDGNLGRAMNRLVRELTGLLENLGRESHHDKMALYSFSPDTESHLLKLKLDVKGQLVSCRFLFVVFRAMDRKIAFTPSLADLWFDMERGESLFDRATEVLTEHFRELLKKEGPAFIKPDTQSIKGDAWITTVEIDISPPTIAPKKEENLFALLGGGQVASGAIELRKTGRCIDWLYPDELDRVVCRDREVEELARLFASRDRRPVLLVGPRLSGKTAIIHEYVYRKIKKSNRSPYWPRRNVWLLSPQRLISGMSYVGQWEERLLAIIGEAKSRGHILYFNDLLGLFHAGISSNSNLSVAHVLKTYIEKRQFRMLGEITPEALRVFRERDRGFADMFQILPVRESNEVETRRIMISLMRQLERQHQCSFDIEVIPEVIDIHRRYGRDAAFPGKAAVFLKRMAIKYHKVKITRANVLEEFHAKSGLSISFLDNRTKLERKEVISALKNEIIGQTAALEAAADAISIAKARLNDPERPLASFLFLGPTGVGKTQCAKAIAAYLFGNADRLLRFDMNEFVSSQSVARLVGAFDQPEGLMTSAIRRQPFSVLLLDEIEKAHPDAFNLLLQVMGDGRLTDALGRTVDFSNAIIILTSNLGVREAASNLGFRQGQSREGSVYVQAAQKFFKPEFFNRLDRILPFERLSREEVQRIAQMLIRGVFSREGLIRRRCILQVDARAMEAVVDEGYHPQLGARALKRAIEKQITQPVAMRLAAMAPESPMVIRMHAGYKEIVVRVEELKETQSRVAPEIELSDGSEVLNLAELAVTRIEEEASALRPEGAIDAAEIDPAHLRYFMIKEQAQRVWKLCRIGADRLARPNKTTVAARPPRSRASKNLIWTAMNEKDKGKQLWKDVLATDDAHAYLKELAAGAKPYGLTIQNFLADLLRELSFLQLLADEAEPEPANQALIVISSMTEAGENNRIAIRKLYERLFHHDFGFEVSVLNPAQSTPVSNAEILSIKGLKAYLLAATEEGTHLFCPSGDNLVPVRVDAMPVSEEEDAASVMNRYCRAREKWLEMIASSDREIDEDPFKLKPVIRIYDEQGITVDLRSGLMTTGMPLASDLRTFVLSMLALPEEFGDDQY